MKFIQTTALGLVLALGLLAYNTQAATNGGDSEDEGEFITSTTRRRELSQEEIKAGIIAKATQAGFSLKTRAENVRLFLQELGAPVVPSAPLAAFQTFVKSAKGAADVQALENAFIVHQAPTRLHSDLGEGFGAFGDSSTASRRPQGLGFEGFDAFGDSSTASRRPQGLGFEGFDAFGDSSTTSRRPQGLGFEGSEEGLRSDRRRTADRRPVVTADRRPVVADDEAAEGFLRGLEHRVHELDEADRAPARTALDLGRRGLEENRALREEISALQANLRAENQRSAAELRLREEALVQTRTQLAQREEALRALAAERDSLRTQLSARPAVDVDALRTQIQDLTRQVAANEQDSIDATEALEGQTTRIQAALRLRVSDAQKLAAIQAALTPAANEEGEGEDA